MPSDIFVHQTRDYGIHADRIGAAGGSSGAYLVDMLGVLDGKGEPDDPDPVNRESARGQCVVALAAPVDFINLVGNRAAFVDIIGMRVEVAGKLLPSNSGEYKTYRDASPLFHISKGAPPFFLMHGDGDRLVAFKNSEAMLEALKEVGVDAKLLRIPRGGHGPDFPGQTIRPTTWERWFAGSTAIYERTN